MFLKKFDRISPLITLSFKGDNMHSSVISGILSIAAYALTTVFGIIYALEFIQKKKPSAYFYSRFIQDAGEFTLNSSSLFHYFYFLNKSSTTIIPFDIDKVRIIGVENVNIDNYYSSIDLELTNHWVYGLCKNDLDAENIGHLIESKEQFESSACIRKYYDSKIKKYIDTSDKNNFVWPSLEGGMSNPTYSFYGIIIEKCKNDKLRELLGLNKCTNVHDIDNYIFSSAIVLKLIDHYSDVLNYKEPFSKYFYSVSNLLFPKSFTINNMNFNPAIMKTHNGIILDDVSEEKSFLFSQNEKVTMDEEVELKDEDGKPIFDNNKEKIYKSTGIVSSYYFWLQNRLQIYERNYKKLQDILSNIGGLSRTFFLCANIINALFSGYFTLSDTEELLFTIDNTNYFEEKIKNINKDQEIKDKINEKKITFKKKRNKEDNQDMIKFSSNKRNFGNNNEIDNKNMFSSLDNFNKEQEKIQSQTQNADIFERKNEEIKSDERKEEESFKKQRFNWFQFILNKIRRNNPIIAYLKEYRTKVISEENFIKGQLDLYKLEKICEHLI